MKSSWCRAFPGEGLPNQQAKPPFKRELNYLTLDFPVSHLFGPEEGGLWGCTAQEARAHPGSDSSALTLTCLQICHRADSCCNLFLQGCQKPVTKTNNDKRWSENSECHPLITSLRSHMNSKCQRRVRCESGHLIRMETGVSCLPLRKQHSTPLHCAETVISGELHFASQITTNIIISDLTLQALGNFLWIHHQPYDYIRENESWLTKRFIWPLPWMFLRRMRLIINCFLLEVEWLFNPYLVTGKQSWWKKVTSKAPSEAAKVL